MGRTLSLVSDAKRGYVLACYRSIELNPVRAGIVRHPRDYHWSSFHANGDGKQDALVMPQYMGLARNGEARREAYRALFKAQLDPDVIERIRSATNGNVVLGSKRFEEQIAKMLKRRVTRGKAGRPKRISEQTRQQMAV